MSAEQGHATVKTYIVIGVILTVITGLEVWISYIPAIASTHWFAPLLIALSALKFALVVMFYMHLKFDHKLFSLSFFAPMVLAVTVIISIITLFRVLPQYKP
jgi:cytochrome c oxidase subunit IV